MPSSKKFVISLKSAQSDTGANSVLFELSPSIAVPVSIGLDGGLIMLCACEVWAA